MAGKSSKDEKTNQTQIIVAIISAFGVVLAATISAYAVLITAKPSQIDSPIAITSTPVVSTPTLISTYSPTAISTNSKNLAPEILNIQTKLVPSPIETGSFWTEYDLYFSDLDGDTITVRYAVIDSTEPNIVLADTPITSTPKMQMAGTVEPLTGIICKKMSFWRTFWTGYTYTVMVSITVIDKAGNESNSFPLQFTC